MHYGTLEQQKGAMKHVGGSGETYMEVRRQLLNYALSSMSLLSVMILTSCVILLIYVVFAPPCLFQPHIH